MSNKHRHENYAVEVLTLAIEASGKPIRYMTYPFQDCSTAIGIRYENHAKIIMF